MRVPGQRTFYAFARGPERLSMTRETETQWLLRSAALNAHITCDTIGETDHVLGWLQALLGRDGWMLVARGKDRRDPLQTQPERRGVVLAHRCSAD